MATKVQIVFASKQTRAVYIITIQCCALHVRICVSLQW